jgi:hypothetical protein
MNRSIPVTGTPTRTRTGDGYVEPIVQADDGVLDEFVAFDVKYVHFEAMSDNTWWIGIAMKDGTEWHIDCGATNPRAKAFAFAEIR